MGTLTPISTCMYMYKYKYGRRVATRESVVGHHEACANHKSYRDVEIFDIQNIQYIHMYLDQTLDN